MAKVGEKYRLKKIKNEWYEVTIVKGSVVVLKTPSGLETIVAKTTLDRDYTQEK